MVLFVFLLFCDASHGWASKGHGIIAEIAETHLYEETKSELRGLLGRQTLAEISNWADKIRSNPSWSHTKPWHYVNIPKGKSYFEVEHHPQGDLLRALYHFEEVLRNRELEKEIRVQALKFLVHFVGDIHQPFHINNNDFGISRGKIKWSKSEIDLHILWDSLLIKKAKHSNSSHARSINHFSRMEKRKWACWDYLDWAYETMKLRDRSYNMEYKADRRSHRRHVDLLNEQLKKGGLRLAFVLNQILLKRRLKKIERRTRREFREMENPFSLSPPEEY